MVETECPDCGFEFDTEAEAEAEDSHTCIAAGCRDCGSAITYDEWHVLYESDSWWLPDAVTVRISAGRPDEGGYRLCWACQDHADSIPYEVSEYGEC